jgi:hypothetical protein
MTLGEKLRYLRQVEGTLRGLEREMTQQEVVRAIRRDMGESISQSYSVADRKRRASAPDQHHAHAAGAFL